VPLTQFLDFLELFLTLKINSKKRKTYPTGTGRARRPDPLQPARGPSTRGQGSHGRTPPLPGRAHPGLPRAPRPYKGGPASPAHPAPARRRRKPDVAALHRASWRPSRLNSAATVDSDFRPPPFVSVAGEHTFAIPSISSLRFGFHPSL
jgi:hypothetical protein